MIFPTHVVVPESVIRQIAMDIKEKMFYEMERNPDFDFTSKGCRNFALAQLFNQVVDDYVKNHTPTYNGYQLSPSVAKIIAHYLMQHQKINAIKEFRSYTGAGLKEAKFLMDEFGTGQQAAAQFMAAFT